MGATVAAKNRKVRQDSLREMLSKKCTVEQIIDIANKLQDQHIELENTHIAALRASADIKLKLLSKYLPDLKSVEMTGEDGKDLIPAAIKIIYE